MSAVSAPNNQNPQRRRHHLCTRAQALRRQFLLTTLNFLAFSLYQACCSNLFVQRALGVLCRNTPVCWVCNCRVFSIRRHSCCDWIPGIRGWCSGVLMRLRLKGALRLKSVEKPVNWKRGQCYWGVLQQRWPGSSSGCPHSPQVLENYFSFFSDFFRTFYHFFKYWKSICR